MFGQAHLVLLLASIASVIASQNYQEVPTPTADQLAWTNLEVGALITWGINSVLSTDLTASEYHTKGPAMCGGCNWSLASLPHPDEFNPVHLDVGVFVEAAKSSGARYLVLSVTHCSGFLLWPTSVSIPGFGRHNYSVAHSSWLHGQGDVVADFVQACREQGMPFGFYVNIGLNMYLNIGANSGSHTVYPTGRFTPCAKVDKPLLPGQVNVSQSEYFVMWVHLLEELLGGRYGNDLTELWLDGGYPDALAANISAILERSQPHAVVFQGPNRRSSNGNVIRWAGTETGYPPSPEVWSTVFSNITQTYGAGVKLGDEFDPSEQDAAIQEGMNAGGFWYPREIPKSSSELIREYEASVGHNSNFLLEIAPDNNGSIPVADLAAYRQFGGALTECYRNRSSVRLALPRNLSCAARICTTTMLGYAMYYNRVRISEDQRFGQIVQSYTIEAFTTEYVGGTQAVAQTWVTIAKGSNIGHQRIHVLPSSALASALRVVVDEVRGHARPVITALDALSCFPEDGKLSQFSKKRLDPLLFL